MLAIRRDTNGKRSLQNECRSIHVRHGLLVMRLVIRHERVVYHRGMHRDGINGTDGKRLVSAASQRCRMKGILDFSARLRIRLVQTRLGNQQLIFIQHLFSGVFIRTDLGRCRNLRRIGSVFDHGTAVHDLGRGTCPRKVECIIFYIGRTCLPFSHPF